MDMSDMAFSFLNLLGLVDRDLPLDSNRLDYTAQCSFLSAEINRKMHYTV